MAVPSEAWHSAEKRREMISKLEEAVNSCAPGPPSSLSNPVEVEKSIFEKSKSQEEYNKTLRTVIIMLSRHRADNAHMPSQQVAPVMQPSMQTAGPGVPHPNHTMAGMARPSPQAGFGGYPHQQPGMGGHVMHQQRHPGQHPQYNPHLSIQSGMHNIAPSHIAQAHNPLQPGYQTSMGAGPGAVMGRTAFHRHQTPMQAVSYSMQGANTAMPPHYMVANQRPGLPSMPGQGMMPAMVRQTPMVQGHVPPYGNPMAQPHPLGAMGTPMRQTTMFPSSSAFLDGGLGGSVQSVTAVPNPALPSAVRPNAPNAMPKVNQGVPITSIATSINTAVSAAAPNVSPTPPQAQPPTSTTVSTSTTTNNNPPTPLVASQSVPSPLPPPTPILPFSPMPASPAQQPLLTPEENTQYMHILSDLQKYIPQLTKMLNKLKNQLGDEKRNSQYMKLKNLQSLLHDSNRRVPLSTLLKCRGVLESICVFQQQGAVKDLDAATPTSLPPTPLSVSISSIPPTEPVIPHHPPLPEPSQSQSLMDFKMLHSPPPTCQNLLQTVHHKPLPAERLPPSKRLCHREETKYPPNLLREMSCLEHFRIIPVPDSDSANSTKYDRVTVLECSLADDGLPPVPSIKVRIPPNYPHTSPECDLSGYESSPFLKGISQLLSDKLSRSHSMHTLSSVLSSWECCVLRAMAKELSEQEE